MLKKLSTKNTSNVKLSQFAKAAGWAAKLSPGILETILKDIPEYNFDKRLLKSTKHNEDAAILSIPEQNLIVQSLDFFTPIVNSPYKFGKIAAVNALSDIYAMGATPWSAMNIVCFPSKTLDISILKEILAGGLEALEESKTALAGGHSIEDTEVKYGMSVTGIIKKGQETSNDALKEDDQLILTKPIGTGILGSAIKFEVNNYAQLENLLYKYAGRLNKNAASIITNFNIKAATDVTGFGLGGHLLEMAKASAKQVEIDFNKVPLIEKSYELLNTKQVSAPGGTCRNKEYFAKDFKLLNKKPYALDLIFDPQTAGGLLLAVSKKNLSKALVKLTDLGENAAHIGEVTSQADNNKKLLTIN